MGKLFLALALVAAMPAPVIAQEATAIVQARVAGLVGERFDGYLGFAVAPPAALRRQVVAINIKRRSLYANLASRRGVATNEVGISAGCALLGRVAVGEAYQLGDGVWRRRAIGQVSPRPAYCG